VALDERSRAHAYLESVEGRLQPRRTRHVRQRRSARSGWQRAHCRGQQLAQSAVL